MPTPSDGLDRSRTPGLGRRRVLAAGAAGVASAALPRRSRATEPPRALRLYNPHTDERFDDVYHDGTGYLERPLYRLNWLLRDFRRDTAIRIDPATLDLVWRLHEKYRIARGHVPWVNVHSAYRTPETNAALRIEGAAQNSFHMRGQAIDVSVQGYGIHILANFAQAVQTGGLGIYWRSRFVHLDTGPRRFWYVR